MWQVWRAVDNGATYRSILTMEKRPSAEEITTAFAADRYTQQKKLLAEAHEDSSATSIDALLTSSTGLIAIAIVLLIAIVFHQRFSIV